MAAHVLSKSKDGPQLVHWAADATHFDFLNNLIKDDKGYTHLLEEKLTAGTCIVIEGDISHSCTEFIVNFRCHEDIAFHINPRFDLRYIARNTKHGKTWGHEESQMLQPIPIDTGNHFRMEILISPLEYLVCINGMHLFTFFHRISYHDVELIEISGQVTVSKFLLTDPLVYPSEPTTPIQLPTSIKSRCPIYAEIDPLQAGDVVEIIARVDSLPQLFYVNLQSGLQNVPHPIIAYHFVVRYTSSWQVAQNSWSSGKWNEEISDKLPSVLLPGETVHLYIRCLPNSYSASANGVLLKPLAYRVPLNSSNTLVIQGDLTVFSVKTSAEKFHRNSNLS